MKEYGIYYLWNSLFQGHIRVKSSISQCIKKNKNASIYTEISGVIVYQRLRIIRATQLQPEPDSSTFQPDTMPPLFQLRLKNGPMEMRELS